MTNATERDLGDAIAEHLAQVVATAPLQREPFDHLALDAPFAAGVYRALLEHLPADDFYRPLRHSDALLPDGRSARLQFPLIEANIDRLPVDSRVLWRAVAAGVQSPRVVEAYRLRFTDALQSVTHRRPAAIRLRPYATLFRDLGGYRISIHPDSPRKAITAQFYLPADDRQAHLGTLFHARQTDGRFTLARALRFVPNCGYAFAVTPHSYHSVATMQPTDRPRNSLMLIIRHDRGVLIEAIKSAQQRIRALYDTLRGRRGGERGEGQVEMQRRRDVAAGEGTGSPPARHDGRMKRVPWALVLFANAAGARGPGALVNCRRAHRAQGAGTDALIDRAGPPCRGCTACRSPRGSCAP